MSSSKKEAAGKDSESDVCGIVMPIAAIEPDYSQDHWQRVRSIISRAITRAKMRPRPVWEQTANDVIHTRIIQNIYENTIVVCDVSGLNPNVMLELGMRLSTKKPTIIVSDGKQKPPFDTGVIEHVFYPYDLEYNATDEFIEKVSDKIVSLCEAAREGTYKSFVENFQFETVTPGTVTVPAEQYISDKIDSLSSTVVRIERALFGSPAPNALKTDNVFAGRASASTLSPRNINFTLKGSDPEELQRAGEHLARISHAAALSIDYQADAAIVSIRIPAGASPMRPGQYEDALSDWPGVELTAMRRT